MSNAKTSLKHAVLSLAAMAIICASSFATADTLLKPTGYVHGSPQSFQLSQGGTQAAGAFAGTWNGADIVFWCIELNQNFGFGGNYTDYAATESDGPMFAMLEQLFNKAYGAAASNAASSAAFQLAIWEIVYDGDLDLHAGSFQVLSGNTDTVAQAQAWLNGLAKFTDTYQVVWLHSATHQDFITGRVPEPAPLMLLAAALLAMIVVTRRRGFKAKP